MFFGAAVNACRPQQLVVIFGIPAGDRLPQLSDHRRRRTQRFRQRGSGQGRDDTSHRLGHQRERTTMQSVLPQTGYDQDRCDGAILRRLDDLFRGRRPQRSTTRCTRPWLSSSAARATSPTAAPRPTSKRSPENCLCSTETRASATMRPTTWTMGESTLASASAG